MEYPVTYYDVNETRNITICVPHAFPAMADVIYGYMIPCVALITICSNSLAVLVFMKTNRKSPTNILLTVLAFSNIFSIGSISPMFFIVYGLQKWSIIFDCSFIMYHDAAYYITSMFHCFSIWLTVVLGVERYIVVAFPMGGPRICKRRNTVVIIIVLFIASFLVMILPNMWSKTYKSLHLNITMDWRIPGVTVEDFCHCSFGQSDYIFNMLYNWMRNLFGTTVPCLTLLVTTVLLLFELQKNNKKIQELHADEHASEQREQKHIKRTSKLILAITACFLLTELPYTIFFTWIIIEPHAHDSALDSNARFTSSIIFNLILYIGCTANFFILILMSKYFRDKLKYFVCMKWVKKTRPTPDRHSTTHSNTYSTRSSNFLC